MAVPEFPQVARGIIKTVARGWFKSPYVDAVTGVAVVFTGVPSLAVLAELREGVIEDVEAPTVKVPTVALAEAPSITIPDVTLRTVSIPTITIPKTELKWWKCRACGYGWTWLKAASCPKCRSTDVEEKSAKDALYALYLYCAKEKLGDWGIFNWARDIIANMIAGLGYYNASVHINIWEGVKSQIAAVESNISKGLKDYGGNVQKGFNQMIGAEDEPPSGSLNYVLDTIKTNIEESVDKGLSDLRDNVQEGLEDLGSNTQSSINSGLSTVIPTLYLMMGLPDGQLVSPVNIRSVRSDSFEFYSLSPGMVIHYLAVGKRRLFG